MNSSNIYFRLTLFEIFFLIRLVRFIVVTYIRSLVIILPSYS